MNNISCDKKNTLCEMKNISYGNNNLCEMKNITYDKNNNLCEMKNI